MLIVSGSVKGHGVWGLSGMGWYSLSKGGVVREGGYWGSVVG